MSNQGGGGGPIRRIIVEVIADLSQFAKSVDAGVKAAADNIQTGLNNAVNNAQAAASSGGASFAQKLIASIANTLNSLASSQLASSLRNVGTQIASSLTSSLSSLNSSGATRGIQDFIQNLLGSINSAVGSLQSSSIVGALQNFGQQIVNSLQNSLKGLSSSNLVQGVTDFVQRFINSFNSVLNSAGSSTVATNIQNFVQGFINSFSSVVNRNTRAFQGVAQSFINSLISSFTAATASAPVNAINNFASNLGNLISTAFNSVMGRLSLSGGGNPLTGLLNNMLSTLNSVGATVLNTLKGFASNVSSILSSIASAPPSSGSLSSFLSGLITSIASAAGGGGSGFAALAAGAGAVGAALSGLVTGGITLAIDSIGKLQEGISSAAEAAINFVRASFTLDVAIRSWQRTSGDAVGSLGSWRKYLSDLHDQFGVFSNTDLQGAAAHAILLGRELGFNRDQMESVIRTATVLGDLYDVNLNEVIERFTQGLIGNYRSLRALGIELDDQSVMLSAHALGIDKTTQAMTSQERGAARLNEILRQATPLYADAAKQQQTYSGQLQKLNAQFTDAQTKIGGVFAGLEIAAKRLGVGVVNAIATALTALEQLFVLAVTGTARFEASVVRSLQAVQQILSDPSTWGNSAKQIEIFRTQLNLVGDDTKAVFQIMQQWTGLSFPGLDDASQELFKFTGTLAQFRAAVGDAADSGFSDFEAATTDFANKIIDIDGAFYDRMEKINREEGQALAKIDQDTADRRARILEDFEDRRQKILREIADLDNGQDEKDRAKKKADEAEDFRIKEARAAEDFEIKRKREREDFLKDLHRLELKFAEDMVSAISNRDATQVLQLRRRFEEEKKQRTEDYDTKSRREQEDYNKDRARDREDFERRQRQQDEEQKKQRESRRKALQQQLVDLEDSKNKELKRLGEDAAKQRAQALQNYRDQRADALKAQAEQYQEAQAALQKRLQAVVQGWVDEGKLDEAGARKVLEIYEKLFGGKGSLGDIDKLVNDFVIRQRRKMEITIDVKKIGDQNGVLPTNPDVGVTAATGGFTMASKPTLAMFGESGPELAAFLPLAKLGTLTTSRNTSSRVEVIFGGKVPAGMDARTADKMIREITSAIKAVVPKETRG